MKNFILFSLVLFLPFKIYAQEGFLKTFDFGTVEQSYQILNYHNRFFLNTATFCNAECSFLTEVNQNGEMLWRTEVPDIDIASGTMVIANDTITVTGNNDPFNTAFRMAHFSLDGEKLGETIDIEHPDRPMTRMFQLTTQYFNNQYVICGAGWEADTAWSVMYVVNALGQLDTLITLQPTNHCSDIWDSYIDQQGRLTTIHQIDWLFSPINHRSIFKFNADFDTVWSYRTNNDEFDIVIPHGCELQDGRTILSVEHPTGSVIIHSLRAIDSTKSTSWQYNYENAGPKERYIMRLKTMKNGDVMGSGTYSEKTQIPRVSGSPWLFRMSPEGELLWEHVYYEYDSTIESSRRGAIFDFVELDDGDIMAVGDIRYENKDMLIMRVDSNGCLNPTDCDAVNQVITTSTNKILPLQNEVLLYPNPVSDLLHIEIPDQHRSLDLQILNLAGQVVQREVLQDGKGDIRIKHLPEGVYFVHISHDGRKLATKKFLKVGD